MDREGHNIIFNSRAEVTGFTYADKDYRDYTDNADTISHRYVEGVLKRIHQYPAGGGAPKYRYGVYNVSLGIWLKTDIMYNHIQVLQNGEWQNFCLTDYSTDSGETHHFCMDNIGIKVRIHVFDCEPTFFL